MKSYCRLLSFFILLQACQPATQNEKERSKWRIQASDTLTFPSDTLHSLHSNFFSVFHAKGGTDYLVQQNRVDNSFYFFNLKSQRFGFKVKIPKKGPNAMGNIAGAYVKSLDSMYIVLLHQNKILLLDTALSIKRSFAIKNKSTYQVQLISSAPLIMEGDSMMILPTLPEEDFINTCRLIKYLPREDKIEEGPSAGDILTRENYGFLYALNSYVPMDANTLIYSFSTCHNLYTYDIAHNKMQVLADVSSSYFTDTKPYPKGALTSTLLSLEHSYYGAAYYDKEAGIIYRTTSLKTEPKDNQGSLKRLYDKPQSLIAYDLRAKQKIGEFKLPPNTFDFFQGFYYNHTVYFLVNNPKNETQRENEFEFIGYRVMDN